MRVVIKVGSNIIADSSRGLNTRRMCSIASAVSGVQDMGHQVVVVSSGAIAAGMGKIGLREKPRDIKLKQAAAAVGQSSLMWIYEKCFKAHKKQVAQVLLTRDGLSDRKMYLNARNTLLTLLGFGVVPIINENDTVAVDEIRFGDNDNLAALVASLIEAGRLVILSDVDGLYTEDPRKNPAAELIGSAKSITQDMLRRAGDSSSAVGTGGMYSKLLAAEKALRSGIAVNIMNGRRPGLLVSTFSGASHGTMFTPETKKLSSRKGWIAYGSRTKGALSLDAGAVRAVADLGKSLLPSGITGVEGDFNVGDSVYCVDEQGGKVAKGITNYSSAELRKIKGLKSSRIEQALGYRYSDEVIHRDNLVVTERG